MERFKGQYRAPNAGSIHWMETLGEEPEEEGADY